MAKFGFLKAVEEGKVDKAARFLSTYIEKKPVPTNPHNRKALEKFAKKQAARQAHDARVREAQAKKAAKAADAEAQRVARANAARDRDIQRQVQADQKTCSKVHPYKKPYHVSGWSTEQALSYNRAAERKARREKLRLDSKYTSR